MEFHDTPNMTDEASFSTMDSSSTSILMNSHGPEEPLHFDQQTGERDTLMDSAVTFLTPVSTWSAVSFFIYGYVSIAIITNIIACYKFIATWNNIVKERRLDIKGFVQRQNRRLTVQEALKTHVTMDTMTCKTCCICMEDFNENELVTQCDGVSGCGKWFHRKCLFTWLDGHDGCPCCRQDMITTKSKGVISNLVEFLGFAEV